jgi:hypothetical protein
LTGKYRHSTPPDSRGGSQHFASFVNKYLDTDSRRIVESLAIASDGLGLPMLTTALSWVLGQPQVASAIIGARTAAQLRGALNTEPVELPPAIISALADVSLPNRSYPEYGWNQG